MAQTRWKIFVGVSVFAFASTFLMQLVVLLLALSPRPPVSYFVGAAIIAAALAVTIPSVYAALIWVMRLWRPAINSVPCGLMAAVLFPVPQLFLSILFREQVDSWQNMLPHVMRLPGEVFISAVPLAFGGFRFASLFAQASERRVV